MAEKHLLPLPQLSPARQIDITGDGGVLKEVLVPGAGALVPQPDDDVSVHYVRWLLEDGVELDRYTLRTPAARAPCARERCCACCPRWVAVVLLSDHSRNAPLISLGGQVSRSPGRKRFPHHKQALSL